MKNDLENQNFDMFQKVFSIWVGKIYEHLSVLLFPLTNVEF
jgi:hypothetical protein